MAPVVATTFALTSPSGQTRSNTLKRAKSRVGLRGRMTPHLANSREATSSRPRTQAVNVRYANTRPGYPTRHTAVLCECAHRHAEGHRCRSVPWLRVAD